MKGEVIEVWASVAMTKWNGSYHLWAPHNGDDYSRDLQPMGFPTEDRARDALPMAMHMVEREFTRGIYNMGDNWPSDHHGETYKRLQKDIQYK